MLYRTGVCTVTFQQDKFRNNLLYLPMIAIVGLLWLGIGYEILGGRVNPLLLAAVGAPVIGTAAKALTDNFIFPDNLIAYGPCPSCEKENRIYFGGILGVEGFGNQGKFKCKNCKSEVMVMKRSLRASTLPKYISRMDAIMNDYHDVSELVVPVVLCTSIEIAKARVCKQEVVMRRADNDGN